MNLPFSTNWNNKLDCQAFTTLRLYQPSRHVVGQAVHITLKGESKGNAVIAAVKPLYLHQINDYIAYLDTGYNAIACQNLVKKMYPHINFNVQQLALILIVKNKETPPALAL